MAGGTNGILGGLQGLAGQLGSTGLGTLLTAGGGLSVSGIGAAMSAVGSLPVLGEVMNHIGFAGSLLQGGTGQALTALTSGSGLDLAGAFQGLSSLTGAIGSHYDIPALSSLSDLTALPALETMISGGQLTINDVMHVATGAAAVAGFTPPANVAGALDAALAATAVITGENGSLQPGPTLLDASRTGGEIMAGLLDSNSSVTPEQIVHKMSELGLVNNLDALEAAGVNGGQAMGDMIRAGSITLEQALNLSSIFINEPDAAVTAALAGTVGGSLKFFDYFERAAAGDVAPRDMSSKRGSETDPKKGTAQDAGSGNYVPDGTITDVPNSYANWNTNYA
jgi:hypothetical protein